MSEKSLCAFIESKVNRSIAEEQLVYVMNFANTKIDDYNRSKWSTIKFITTILLAIIAGYFALLNYINNIHMNMIVAYRTKSEENFDYYYELIDSLNIVESEFMNTAMILIKIYVFIVLGIIVYNYIKRKKWRVLHNEALMEYLSRAKKND
ncbi:hypothetical protein HB892_05585 [Listeria welshimeri]|uniref:hypothetical protein n=1 Tax=Listeria welshimeri TaxID=1643 RepID=UPI0016253C78|nr:hypothetical protein [Listeria welshimeri]MBC1477203.1 hypothetical protein [Listeria welshimeri]MBF2677747.1 hypothetical protein [Listeria welshimeri]